MSVSVFHIKYSVRNLGLNTNFGIQQKVHVSCEKSWGISPAIGNTGVISLHYQLAVCFVSVSLCLRLCLAVFCLLFSYCLHSHRTVGDRKVAHRQLFWPVRIPWNMENYFRVFCMEKTLGNTVCWSN